MFRFPGKYEMFMVNTFWLLFYVRPSNYSNYKYSTERLLHIGIISF